MSYKKCISTVFYKMYYVDILFINTFPHFDSFNVHLSYKQIFLGKHVIYGAGETAQLVKCSPCKHKGEFGPQQPHEKPGPVERICNLADGECRGRWIPQASRPASLV